MVNYSMRIRTIKPEFWKHPIIARLPDDTKLMAIGLLNLADDEGYFHAVPQIIRAEIFPFSDSSVRVHGMITELSDADYVEVRNHPKQGEIGHIINFLEHQVVNRPRPSKLLKYFTESKSVTDHGSITEPSRPEGKGRERKGKEVYTPEFKKFWKAYPKRNGKKAGKADAFAEYKNALKKTDADTLLNAVIMQARNEDWQKDNGSFIPDAHRWLKKSRWEDEVSAGPGTKPKEMKIHSPLYTLNSDITGGWKPIDIPNAKKTINEAIDKGIKIPTTVEKWIGKQGLEQTSTGKFVI